MRRLVALSVCLGGLFALATLSSCTLPYDGAQTPASSPSQMPAGWKVYHGDHFSIAYPAGWSTSTPAIDDGGQTAVVVLSGPKPRDQIEVTEILIIPQNTTPCAVGRGQPVMLAGLPMRYEVVEGVHRVWSYFTSAHIEYALSALDADQSTATQSQHDAILATFRPDDHSSGCP
ncbi:MAG TPA: hypothetical protein VFN78_05745 [Ktedonobacterales bacterium]|nr:hypothetical protein [Ktedonobacterales bacterium]